MSKRLEAIRKMLDGGNRDPFTRYAYAMELKGLGRNEEALAAFEELRAQDPAYLAQYLMAGGVCEALGRRDDAARWYDEGIARAGNDPKAAHALSELSAARGALG
jgi:tetratricopeptide (TPR) repeat protein